MIPQTKRLPDGSWSARCDCRADHGSASGRCNVRDVHDPSALMPGDAVYCERCRVECRADVVAWRALRLPDPERADAMLAQMQEHGRPPQEGGR